MITNSIVAGGSGIECMRVTVDAEKTTIANTMPYFRGLVPSNATFFHAIWRPFGDETPYTQYTSTPTGHNGEVLSFATEVGGSNCMHTRYGTNSAWLWQNPSGAYDSKIFVGDIYDIYYTTDDGFSPVFTN